MMLEKQILGLWKIHGSEENTLGVEKKLVLEKRPFGCGITLGCWKNNFGMMEFTRRWLLPEGPP